MTELRTIKVYARPTARAKENEMTTNIYDLIRWGYESQEGYAPAYCRICGAILSTFDKAAPIGERFRWNGCEHIEAARKCSTDEK